MIETDDKARHVSKRDKEMREREREGSNGENTGARKTKEPERHRSKRDREVRKDREVTKTE